MGRRQNRKSFQRGNRGRSRNQQGQTTVKLPIGGTTAWTNTPVACIPENAFTYAHGIGASGNPVNSMGYFKTADGKVVIGKTGSQTRLVVTIDELGLFTKQLTNDGIIGNADATNTN